MVLALSEQATPEFEASLASAVAEVVASKRCADALAASARAAAKALASRVDMPQEGLAKLSSMLVRLRKQRGVGRRCPLAPRFSRASSLLSLPVSFPTAPGVARHRRCSQARRAAGRYVPWGGAGGRGGGRGRRRPTRGFAELVAARPGPGATHVTPEGVSYTAAPDPARWRHGSSAHEAVFETV